MAGRELSAALTEALRREIGAEAVEGVSLPNPLDRSGWRVDFTPAATPEQRAAAAAYLSGYDQAADSDGRREQFLAELGHSKALTAALLWAAERFGISDPEVMRDEIFAIYQQL